MRTFDGQFGPGRVVFGAGTIGVVPEELRRLGVGRPLVLATPEQADLAQQVATAVGAAAVFSGAKMHTPVEVTREALAVLDEAGADSVVSVGGGSTTGLGKAVASRAAVPHLVVPTTYAGSEVTPVLGETADGEKVTRSGPEILPNTVVYDVDLTTTLPWSMTLTSAVNAMAHAVEALYAPDRGVETDAMATGAIGALATGLRALHGAGGHVAPDGSDGDHGASTSPQTPAESLAPDRRDASRVLDARADLLYGAWLAGRCLGAVGMGLHHKLCHTLGGSFGLPHAPTHTVVLPHAMAYNAAAAPEAMTLAASALQVHEAPSGLHELVGELGGPTDLQALGFSLDDIARAADLATARPYPNPRPVTRDGITLLLERAARGETP